MVSKFVPWSMRMFLMELGHLCQFALVRRPWGRSQGGGMRQAITSKGDRRQGEEGVARSGRKGEGNR